MLTDLLIWGGAGYVLYRLLRGEKVIPGTLKPTPAVPGEEPGWKPKSPGGGFVKDPCARNLKDLTLARWVVDMVAQRPGVSLPQKTPSTVLPEVQEVRIDAGAAPVNLKYRELDPDQKPCEWIANMAYWAAYPKGPVKIPSATHPCAAHWMRVFEIVKDQLRNWGLM